MHAQQPLRTAKRLSDLQPIHPMPRDQQNRQPHVEPADIKTTEDLVRELRTGSFEPVDFRPRRKPVPHAVAEPTR